ncbi:MAG: GAF domain-containing protein, partial [Bdellovibrionota bacterium]
MLRSLLSLAIFLFAAPHALGAQFQSFECRRLGAEALCRIYLTGTVGATDRLFLSRVNDRDTLTFHGHVLGTTGSFVGRDFHAGFFPRVYPLNAIAGETNPVLILHAEGGLMHAPGIPLSAKTKIIDAHYPLWKILGGAALQLLSFAFLALLGVYLLFSMRQRNSDGWVYPRDELRWCLGGLCAYLLLRHEVSELFVPVLWQAGTHLFTQRIALFLALWSASSLLLGGRFSDRSCIERHIARPATKALLSLSHLALVTSLAVIAYYPALSEHSASCLLAVPLVPLLFAQGRAIYETEWRRVTKRSSRTPLLFHVGLLALPLGVLLTALQAWHGGSGDQRAIESAAWVVVLLAGLRMRALLVAREKGRELAAECRHLLTRHSGATSRLQALCDFMADEWGAARVSVISVEEDTGLVLSSAGPEAIPEAGREEPRRLGPFLRRVCKESHMLYAPVAEELGQDLRSEGLKHSSLAIPLSQEGAVRAVVCMMADEGERIPPADAAQLEMLIETLSLEILSAVGQNVADSRHLHLLEIARTVDALAVENLDHWGLYHPSPEALTRVVLGGDSIPAGPFFDQLKKSPVLGKIWQAYRSEMRAIWTTTAAAFEFIPKDNRDDFWVISPRQFRNPMLQELGAERVGLLLATTLEKH